MLPGAFLDWWFAPWDYAAAAVGEPLRSADLAGRRDGYRLWCEQAGVAPTLPASFDPAWQVAAHTDGGRLTQAARLFGGLFAARRQQGDALAQLALDERKWCMSIASLQPVKEAVDGGTGTKLELRGLAELAWRLERAFPGMWPRLRLLLTPEQDEGVAALLAGHARAEDGPDPSAARILRCWQLCRRRAGDE